MKVGLFRRFSLPLAGRVAIQRFHRQSTHTGQTISSAGILTCSSIGYPRFTSGLALGPTNPGTILVALETLVFRRAGLSPAFLLLVPAFSLQSAPSSLTG